MTAPTSSCTQALAPRAPLVPRLRVAGCVRLSALLLGLLTAWPAAADEVRVAVAANFAATLKALEAGFQAATGHQIKATSGSTGKFYQQIVAGAPFDVLLSADRETPQRLIDEGYAQAGTAFTYATGRLVLWSAQPGLVDAQGEVLGSTRFQHLAIAHPKLAPYGRAAMEVLAARGVLEQVRARLVTGDNIAQAYQFVATGNAELGLVAWSQVPRSGNAVVGSYWLVPQTLHGALHQDAVLLKSAQSRVAAQAWLNYLKSGAARAVITQQGYTAGVP